MSYNPIWFNSPVKLPKNGFINYVPQEAEKQKTKEPKDSLKTTINGIDGCVCAKCGEFYPYAEPNMDDGSMVCYSCRNPWP